MIVCIALAAGANAQTVGNDTSTKASPEQGKQPAAPNPQPIFPPAVQDAIERAASALEAASNDPNAAAERQRSQADLDAQRSMAFWAMAMFFVALGGTIITGVARALGCRAFNPYVWTIPVL